jgi:hypothetical protein
LSCPARHSLRVDVEQGGDFTRCQQLIHPRSQVP